MSICHKILNMEKVEYYRQFFAFKELCASGKQSCSFLEYCRELGVSYYRMYLVLKEEYPSLNEIPGYTRGSSLKFRCSQVYEDFKTLCAYGRQPGTFIDYYKGFGITEKHMKSYLWRNRLQIQTCLLLRSLSVKWGKEDGHVGT